MKNPYFKPLSVQQVQALKECRQQFMDAEDPGTVYYTRYHKRLIKEKFIEAKFFVKDGKQVMGFFITKSGLDYLDKIELTQEK